MIVNILPSIDRLAHIASNQSIILSRGLFPSLSPPGIGTVTLPNFANNGPIKKADALDTSPNSSGTEFLVIFGDIEIVLFHTCDTSHHNNLITSETNFTSFISGILSNLVDSDHNNEAIMSL